MAINIHIKRYGIPIKTSNYWGAQLIIKLVLAHENLLLEAIVFLNILLRMYEL